MASRTLISVEEYLGTSYRPDCDYVDGEVLERNMGEKSHAKLQKAILLYLSAREKELRIWVIQEQRVQVSSKRFRIPDVCVTLGEPRNSPSAALHLHRDPLSLRPLAARSRTDRRLPRHGSTLRVGT